MTEKQIRMLQKAQLDWLDRELANHDVPKWVMDSLRNDEFPSIRISGAIAWLEKNDYVVEMLGNHARLMKGGEELSRFVWTVE